MLVTKGKRGISMIFISGVHGVGKTYFSNLVKSELHINSYTASELIEKSRNLKFNENNVNVNQKVSHLLTNF